MTNKEYRLFLYQEFIQAEEKIDSLFKELVTTIPDECKGVGLEIGTSSKREAIVKIEDIVCADGNIR